MTPGPRFKFPLGAGSGHTEHEGVLMAVEYSSDPIVPVGTGAVENPEGPITYEQTPGHPVGTGAVEGPDGPVTYEFGPLGQDGTGAAPDPEPVTYVNEAFAKVVRPASGRRAAESTDTAETKQQTADSLPGAQK